MPLWVIHMWVPPTIAAWTLPSRALMGDPLLNINVVEFLKIEAPGVVWAHFYKSWAKFEPGYRQEGPTYA